MSRINKNKMWMGNPVLRQQSFYFIANETPAQLDNATSATFVSYLKSGKTMIEEVSGSISVDNDVNTTVTVYGNISAINAENHGYTFLNIQNLTELTELEIVQMNITILVLPKNKISSCDIYGNKLNSFDASAINPETIERLNVSGNPFLSDETAALSFANSLPTVTTSPTLTMASSDTQATAVQSIAESKGWTVSIS